ncbi:MAG: D-alanyl-D-alanine carboxypeptidase family protein [Xanthomonadales bacterium]|nr:D-alanyl-D-alanine carboxypeptidase family protein [Xanthomonadales bacterium]
MSTQVPQALRIRPATAADVAGIVQLLARAGRGGKGAVLVLHHSDQGNERALRNRTLDGCLLLAEIQGKLAGIAGIDLAQAALSDLVVGTVPHKSTVVDALLAGALLERAERLALAFGVLHLRVAVTAGTIPWFLPRAYRPGQAVAGAASLEDGASLHVLTRSLRRRQTRYARLVARIGEELGIPGNYGQLHRLQLQNEAGNLHSIGLDVFGREQRMAPRAAAAWQRMSRAAVTQGIELQPVSAWRSVSYQQGLVQRKLEKGLALDAILQVSAAPGYSEHHTGRAIDITSPGCTALAEEFAHSPAFRWLQRHAPGFGFELSFPRRNRHKLAYEPWHWCFRN